MSEAIHPATAMGPVQLVVTDLDRSLRFYRDVLGFQVLVRNENNAVLTANGNTPLVTLEEQADAHPKPPGTTGLYHFAILLPHRTDLARCLRHLRDHPIRLGSADHQFSEALYLNDPDGNGIELYRDRPQEVWERDEHGGFLAVSEPLDVKGLLAAAGDEPWQGLPAGTRIGHIHLHVADLQQAEAFYGEGLGFEPTIRWNDALFVSAGGYHHHIGLNTWAGEGAPPPPANTVGLHHFSIVVPADEIQRIAQRLQKLDAVIIPDGESVWTTDPFANRIRIDTAHPVD